MKIFVFFILFFGCILSYVLYEKETSPFQAVLTSLPVKEKEDLFKGFEKIQKHQGNSHKKYVDKKTQVIHSPRKRSSSQKIKSFEKALTVQDYIQSMELDITKAQFNLEDFNQAEISKVLKIHGSIEGKDLKSKLTLNRIKYVNRIHFLLKENEAMKEKMTYVNESFQEELENKIEKNEQELGSIYDQFQIKE
jgi:hypothetical protein